MTVSYWFAHLHHRSINASLSIEWLRLAYEGQIYNAFFEIILKTVLEKQ